MYFRVLRNGFRLDLCFRFCQHSAFRAERPIRLTIVQHGLLSETKKLRGIYATRLAYCIFRLITDIVITAEKYNRYPIKRSINPDVKF